MGVTRCSPSVGKGSNKRSSGCSSSPVYSLLFAGLSLLLWSPGPLAFYRVCVGFFVGAN